MDSLDLYASNSCPVFMRVVYWVPFRGRVNLSLSISGNRLYFIELFDSVGVGHRLVLSHLLNSGVKAYQTCPHRPPLLTLPRRASYSRYPQMLALRNSVYRA